ncbi:MAG: hypothetical protein KJO85_11265 [Gammaproteobacteria bacterium]|nr:hypothetical protein [Gammaproteobacteria bacterium]
MKLFTVLLIAATLLALTIYDYAASRRLAESGAVVEERIGLLLRRERDRFEILEHVAAWLQAEDYTPGLSDVIESHELFSRTRTWAHELQALQGWEQRNELLAELGELIRLQQAYRSIPFAAQSMAENRLAVQRWAEDMIAQLDEIQFLDIELTRHLSDRSNDRLGEILFVNAAAMMALLIFSLLVLHFDQRRSLGAIRKVNEQLGVRQTELENSRKILISVMEDLSLERNAATKLSEDLQVANTAMGRKNDEMEQFIYTVSHDLKSPLVTIAAFSKKLDEDLSGQLGEKQAHYLHRIQHNVEHMEALLSDLLQLSRVIRQDIHMEELDTAALVAEQVSLLDAQIREYNARVILDEPLAPIYANARLVSQCLSNLLSNAIKYRDDSRPLVIEVETTAGPNETVITVRDNGLGIDEKYHQQIFRIFERLEYGEGTGVGLTIIDTIVDRHGGRVELESKPGEGSAFSLHFPDIGNKGEAA